ncbi:hypothetical protein DENSPDRAFT_523375 [Dentipellis sp. KUC8613]|nr:hypothetical protein DENSPDRAFT_523375 [Dentipellis sp. KUC8613]
MLISSLQSILTHLTALASLLEGGGIFPAVFNGSGIAPVLMGWFGPAPLLIPPNRVKHPSCSLDDFSSFFTLYLPVCTVFNGTQFQHATDPSPAFTFLDTPLDTAIPHATTTLLDITAPSSLEPSPSAAPSLALSAPAPSSPAPSSGTLPHPSQEQPPPSSVPEEPPALTISDILLLIGFCTLVIALLILSLYPCTPVWSLASDLMTFISSALIDIHTLPYRWVACAEEKAALLRLIGTLDQKAKKFARQLLAMENERHAAFFRETALEDRVLILADDLAVLQRERKIASRTLQALRNSLLDSSTPESFDSATDDLQTNLRELETAVESQIQVRSDNKELLDTVTILRSQLEERQELLDQRDSQIAALLKELSARPVPATPVESADNGASSPQPDDAKPRSQPDFEKPHSQPDDEKPHSLPEVDQPRPQPDVEKPRPQPDGAKSRPQPDGEKKLSWREKRYGSKKGKGAAKGSPQNGQGSAAPATEDPKAADSTVSVNATSSKPSAPVSSAAETTITTTATSTPSTQSPLPVMPVENVSGDASKATSSASSSAPPLLLPAREGGSGCDAGEMWSTSAASQSSQQSSGNPRGHPQSCALPPRPQFRPPPSQHSRPPPHPFPPPPHYPHSHPPRPPHEFTPAYIAQHPRPPAFGLPLGHPMHRRPQPGFPLRPSKPFA